MPCPRSRCSLPSTFKTEDGTEMRTWHSIRREHLHNMRRTVKRVVLYMALIEAIRIGPDAMVFAGKNGYPERGADDFGIAYYAGYILSWLYLCVFSLVWKPLFSWWVKPSPSNSEGSHNLGKFASALQQLNMFLLPVCVGLSLIEHVFWTVMTFLYVDAQPVEKPRQLPKNTQKTWLARLMLLVGIFTSVTLGHCMFEVFAEYDLAHVKQVEYLIIVLPIQINLGVLIGSGMQWRMEKRMERKRISAAAVETGSTDEKAALLTV